MADLRISDVPRDPAGNNIARNDEIIVFRNGIDYLATVSGALLLPAYTTADAGKRLQVGTDGTASWAGSSASQANGWSLRHTITSPRGSGQGNVMSGFDLSDYADIHVNLAMTTGSNYGLRMYPILNVSSYTPQAGFSAYFSNNSTLYYSLPASFGTPRTVYVYGRTT